MDCVVYGLVDTEFMLRFVGRFLKRPDIQLAWREKVTIFFLILHSKDEDDEDGRGGEGKTRTNKKFDN